MGIGIVLIYMDYGYALGNIVEWYDNNWQYWGDNKGIDVVSIH